MKLYDCAIAPNPRRARIFIAEKGLQIPRIEVDLLAGENLKAEFRTINPRGTVPVLELDDGTRIDEAPAIFRYLEEICPDPPLLGRDPVEKARIESRERHMEFDGMNAVGEIFRNTHPGFARRRLPGVSFETPAVPALVEQARLRVAAFYARLESYLAEAPFVAGKHYSSADITALCVVDFAGWVELTIPKGHANTLRWHESVSARPSAKA